MKGQSELQPILFGGFTFDPQNEVTGEWTDFPEAYFALATYQLVIRDDKAFVSIHLISKMSKQRLNLKRYVKSEII